MKKVVLSITPDLPGGYAFERQYVLELGSARDIPLRAIRLQPVGAEETRVDARFKVSEAGDITAGSRLVSRSWDARPLNLIKPDPAAVWSERSYIPDNRPLWEILADVARHASENPTHGPGCACMDHHVREIRLHVYRALEPRAGNEMWTDAELYAKDTRVRHYVEAVLNQVIRGIR